MKDPQATTRIVNSLGEQYPLLGIAMKHHRTTRGKALSFHDKPYLIELYCDAPKIEGFDAMKAVQVGWSELLIQLALEDRCLYFTYLSVARPFCEKAYTSCTSDRSYV